MDYLAQFDFGRADDKCLSIKSSSTKWQVFAPSKVQSCSLAVWSGRVLSEEGANLLDSRSGNTLLIGAFFQTLRLSTPYSPSSTKIGNLEILYLIYTALKEHNVQNITNG